MNPRMTALRLLLRYEEDGAYPNLLLSEKSAGEGDARDRAFLTTLLYGTVEHKLTLDYAIACYTENPADKLTAHTRALLRMGLYQIFYLDRVPAFAAVHETVALAAHKGEASLLNGVLRHAVRDGRPPLPPREKNPARYLSVAMSFPLATVKRFIALFGEKATEDILRCYNEAPRITLRINTMKTTRAAYLRLLAENGIAAEEVKYAPFGVRLAESCDPTVLPGFADGLFFVQDEASQIAGAALAPEEGAKVLDLCACPGGKSFSAAMYMRDTGEILACDLHASKLPLVKTGADRLGLTAIHTMEHDATEPLAGADGIYDCVIADVPCSGLGVLGKKPDLRYADPARFSVLPPLQAAILDRAAACVRPGGVLLYSTCTLLPEENEERVRAFLDDHRDFIPEPFSVGALTAETGMVTLFPHIHRTDGFFIARMRRKD